MALKRRQEEVETQALKSIVEQGAQVQPVVLEYDTAETRGLSADQKARALRENGILVLSNQDAAEFLGDVTWKTLGDDKMQEHEPHVAIHMHQEKENHAKEECQKKPVRLSMDGDIFQKLASSIQWGNVTDPETQKALLAGISLNENANNNAEKKGKEDMVSLDLTPMSRMNQFDREISEEAENLGATFCEKHNCNNYRPPRTHHCSKCKRCVTRMDHHCIWIGRCVGEGNIKNFNLFLFYYILASSIFVLLSNIAFFYHGIHADSLLGVLHAMLYVVALISAAGLCPLLWSQLNNIWNNNTEMEKIFTSRDAITRYSKGSKFENMKLVFGKNILYWPIPN